MLSEALLERYEHGVVDHFALEQTILHELTHWLDRMEDDAPTLIGDPDVGFHFTSEYYAGDETGHSGTDCGPFQPSISSPDLKTVDWERDGNVCPQRDRGETCEHPEPQTPVLPVHR